MRRPGLLSGNALHRVQLHGVRRWPPSYGRPSTAKAAEHALRGEAFTLAVQRWVKVEGGADKQLVTKTKSVRPWWWKGETGQIMLSLRHGSRIMDLADGKQSIEVGGLDDLPKALEVIRAAVVAGELDEQLRKSPYVRPVVKPKGK